MARAMARRVGTQPENNGLFPYTFKDNRTIKEKIINTIE
jgi:hypothetical protein